MKQKIKLSTPLSNIKSVRKDFLPKLKRLGLKNVKDLLWHFPNRYDDFSSTQKISDIHPDQKISVKGEIEELRPKNVWRRGFIIMEAIIKDDSGSVKVVWFNQPYLNKVLKEGEEISVSGTPKIKDGEIQFLSPAYERNKDNKENIHTERIVPVYPETKGLTSRGIRYLIKPILDEIDIDEPIPIKILKEENIPEINTAIRKIHFPEKSEDITSAKRRFLFDSLFVLQLSNLKRRADTAQKDTFDIKIDPKNNKQRIKKLPFKLTNDQKKALKEVLDDISKPHPMNRLLQGDVGSGKTIVAFLAILQIIDNDYQAAIMAPTEILAAQHYENIKNTFPELKEKVALLTNNSSKVFYKRKEESVSKKELIKNIGSGNIKIIIGTHSLIQKNVNFKDLAFVVVDEQQRFGVRQRMSLLKNNDKTPHLLSMSATPIPRTLALTVFSDLDLSYINELPKNRKPIITKVVPPKDRDRAYNIIRQNTKNGHQTFVICPRIESKDDDSTEIRTVESEYDKLSKNIFPDLRIGMLHSKLKKEDKDLVIRRFADNDIDILISTSMVEVGVDIPNATIMMIENAEYFGLSQLYQFRGRVGRGEHRSYCLLFTETTSKETFERLKAVESAKNGLELAELDLKMRGPGELLGKSQTGIPDRAMEALQDKDLISSAKKHANEIMKNNELDKYPLLKKRLDSFENLLHKE